MTKRIAINSGGSFVPGLNAVLAGAILAANELGHEVVGVDDGYEGLLFPDRYPNHGLAQLSVASIDTLLEGPNTFLGTSRLNPFQVRTVDDELVDETDRSQDLLEAASKEDIDGMISVVGRGAMSIALRLERKGLRTLCVPESIENDIADTVAFGFNSALSFSAVLLGGIRASAMATQKVAVVEVPGEHTGWLALQSGMASVADAILIPEIRYDLDIVAERLKHNARSGRPPALVVVAEGARRIHREGATQEDSRGALEAVRRALSPSGSAENAGARVIRRSGHAGNVVALGLQRCTGIECFSLNLDHILRGGRISPADRQIGLAYGAAAVRGLCSGRSGEMIAFQPPRLGYVPLVQAVNNVRTVPADSELLTTARLLGISFGDGTSA